MSLNKELINACELSDFNKMKQLIKEGADIHYNNDHALYLSAWAGNLEAVKYLLSLGANIHTHDDYPLQLACQRGFMEIVDYLLNSPELKEHANINALNSAPLRNAVTSFQYEIIDYLLNNPKLDVKNNIIVDEEDILRNVVRKRPNLLKEVTYGNDYALKEEKSLKIIELLLKHNIQDKNEYSLNQTCKNGDIDVMILYVKYGADINKMKEYAKGNKESLTFLNAFELSNKLEYKMNEVARKNKI